MATNGYLAGTIQVYGYFDIQLSCHSVKGIANALFALTWLSTCVRVHPADLYWLTHSRIPNDTVASWRGDS